MKKVMVRAWEIAREAVNKFGGKVKEFFQQALIMAWKEVKGGDKMVELQGTEKQVKWAEDIRENLLMVITELKNFQEKAGSKIPTKEIELENKEIEVLRTIAEETAEAKTLIKLYQGLKKNDYKINILNYVCNGYITTYSNRNYTTKEAPALERLVKYAVRKGYVK